MKLASRTTFVLLALLLGLSPLLAVQFQALVRRPMLFFFPLAWLIIAIYLYRVPKIGFAYEPRRRSAATVILCLGVAVGLLSSFLGSPNMAHLAILLATTAWLLINVGIVPWTRLVCLSLFAWVAWPLPGGLWQTTNSWIVQNAIGSCSRILDLFNVFHLATARAIELQLVSIDISQILGQADSLPFFCFFTLWLLFYWRRPLVLGIAAFLSLPLIHWVATVLYLLVQVAIVESSGTTTWLDGWPLFLIRCIYLLFECGLIYFTVEGLTYLLEPVPVDDAKTAERGVQGLYNRLVMWPMNVVLDSDDDHYFDDEQAIARNKQEIRNLPRYQRTHSATDPLASRGVIGLASACALIFVFSLANLIVPEASSSAPLADLDEARAQDLTHFDPFDNASELKLLGSGSSGQDSELDLDVVAWNLASDRETGTLRVEYPTQGYVRVWSRYVEKGYRQNGPVLRRELGQNESWPVLEVNLLDSLGNQHYLWTTTFTSEGNPYLPSADVITNLRRRLESSVIGRFMGAGPVPHTFQCTMLVQSGRPLPERRLSQLAATFLDSTRRVRDQIVAPVQEASGSGEPVTQFRDEGESDRLQSAAVSPRIRSMSSNQLFRLSRS